MDQNNYNLKVPLQDDIDHLVTEALSKWGQGASRRDFLTQLGKIMLALVGASLARALPADRRVALAFNPPSPFNCTDWRWCGMVGYPCACCGGGNGYCPGSGCSWGGTTWTACCEDPTSGCPRLISYWDCCGSCSASCNCYCSNSVQQFWCSGGTDSIYRCTLAIASPCWSCSLSPRG